ncbi:acylamino-acid-releasing enzyme-like [Trichogramma pretiosum]|uniref:acylamino-acid-releasing enzyme-like n=1 Tax=Trichogramma pretiosum TaxID=7493 RepID=UPI0006C93F81|nr:acylamino-acid-releasing enzyme-like [Trichogramma pretiosum]
MAEEPTKANEIDKILDLYKCMSLNPYVVSARIISIARNGISVQTVWAQRNLERNEQQKFTQDLSLDAELQLLVESFPIDVSTQLLTTSSENEKFKAILRQVTVDGKPKQYIEVWDRQHRIRNYDLSAYDVHGEIYSDNIFSSFHFSPDNTKLMYVAEKKLPKVEPFYTTKPKKQTPASENKPEPIRGQEYAFKPHWGEQLEGRHRSVVIILNLQNDTFSEVTQVPDEYFPAETIWSAKGDCIVGVAYKRYPRYLGRFNCSNRESYLFVVKNNEFRLLTTAGKACKTPQFSPDGRYLIWLERETGKQHHNVQRLMKIQWGFNETPDILVDVVKTSIEIADKKKFFGFYGHNIPKRCWSRDSKYLFLSTQQRSNIKSYVVSLETKIIAEIENPDGSSLNILDVRRNRIVFTRTSNILPPQLVVGKFDPTKPKIGAIKLVNLTKPLLIPSKERLIYEHIEFEYKTDEPVRDFNFTYFGYKSTKKHSMPLLVVPHGGPHDSFCNQFNMDLAIFALLGFAIIQINYRGSSGMGRDNIEFLTGNIGETDVLDCMTALKLALAKYPHIDPAKVALYGACHGAFLCAHLSGQNPDLFRAVVMKTPIIDIPSMYTNTDIPDWCPANTGCKFLERLPPAALNTNYSEITLHMFDRSPIQFADKVKAPTLIAVGTKDLRCHSSQGRLWYGRLTANQVPAKLYVYGDNQTLSKEEIEIDFVINASLWLIKHVANVVPQITIQPTIVAEEVKLPVEDPPVKAVKEEVEVKEEEKTEETVEQPAEA